MNPETHPPGTVLVTLYSDGSIHQRATIKAWTPKGAIRLDTGELLRAPAPAKAWHVKGEVSPLWHSGPYKPGWRPLTSEVEAGHAAALADRAIVQALRDTSNALRQGKHTADQRRAAVPWLRGLVRVLGLEDVTLPPPGEPIRAEADPVNGLAVVFWAEEDLEVRHHVIRGDPSDPSLWVSGDYDDSGDDLGELHRRFAGGVYASLDAYRAGDARPFDEVLAALTSTPSAP